LVEGKALAFNRPPLWEVGLAVMAQGVPFYDPYDVRSLHEALGSSFPKHERQPLAIPPMQPYPTPRNPVAIGGPQQVIMPLNGLPDRWWFLAEHGRDLVQIQENLLARNWRRLEPLPAPITSYPGFDSLFNDFQGVVRAVDGWNHSRGRAMPPPFICDLLYDNLIPLMPEGGPRFALSDVFPAFGMKGEGLVFGLHTQWLERIDPHDTSKPPLLSIQALAGSPQVPLVDELPYVKLTFNARSPVSSWEEVWTFFQTAHARIRERLVELTSEECRATWEPDAS
jgi:uncharacterized protein (TIGR04255 family)